MKIVLQDNRRYVLRFDKDEEVVAGVGQFMADQNIQACSFSGIGSCTQIELGYYNPHLKQYRQRPYLEELEIVNLIGTGGVLDSKPVVHVHGMFGRTDFSVVGGHVFKVITGATCEIFLIKLEGTLQRQKNPDFDLNLLV